MANNKEREERKGGKREYMSTVKVVFAKCQKGHCGLFLLPGSAPSTSLVTQKKEKKKKKNDLPVRKVVLKRVIAIILEGKAVQQLSQKEEREANLEARKLRRTATTKAGAALQKRHQQAYEKKAGHGLYRPQPKRGKKKECYHPMSRAIFSDRRRAGE